MHFLVGFISVLILVKVHTANAAYLSYKKVTTSKSLYRDDYPRKATTDGDDYSRMDMQSSSCFHSDNGNNQWLKIDLEKEYTVTRVTIINRVQPGCTGCHDRLVGAEVRIGNDYSAMVNEQKCGMSVSNEQVETSAIVDLTCDEPISGRYLMLRNPQQTTSLNVCEIRVYNEDEPEISECSLDSQFYSDYRGLVSITENGQVCQAWTSQSPHSHSATIDAEKGIGDHNLCRNPGTGETRPWCYTTDPDIRWDFCDVAEAGTSCPLATDTKVVDMGALEIVELDSNSMASWFTSRVLPTMTMISAVKNDNDILQSVNTLVSVASNSFHGEVNALTLTMYIYPNGDSSGEILSAGNGNTRLRIEQTYSNELLYHSEVTVFYGDQQLTRAHVLLPEAWTYLAITFDGTSKTIKLWRNGEIASIGFTDFNSFDLMSAEFQLGSSNGDLFAKVALLQVYDRVLNEAEIKAIRDIAFVEAWLFDGQAKFTKLITSFRLTGSQLYEGTESLMVCSRTCLQRACCKAFRFSHGSNSCTLLSTFEITNSLPEESDVEYYQKDYHSYLSLRQC